MCGICGILDNSGELSSCIDMNNAQSHRGPDDEGYVFLNTISGHPLIAGGPNSVPELDLFPFHSVPTQNFDLVLASRRLAILDLSPAGHMPMTYSQGKLWIVHNGEVYNYRELRAELKEKGYSFVSDSDTEVILAAYSEWGEECLSHFNGMFAFALFDVQKHRLFCGRDRFGIKPFYYYLNGSTFIFASEIKALLQNPKVPIQPNDQIIFDYLILGVSDHTEQTFFQDIFQLPAGHYLILDSNSGQFQKKRWWQASINPNLDVHSPTMQQGNYDLFENLLEDAVRLRLRSDVPVGSCLSGGLDSSSIVCLTNRLLLSEQVIPHDLIGDHQKTFTARNKESAIDEYKYSHLVVTQTGAEENLVLPTGEVLWNEIKSFVWHMDEPVDSTSQYPQWNVMRLARQRGVTVLLDGQGGDEILAGYLTYYAPFLSQVQQKRGWLSMAKAGYDVCNVVGKPAFDELWTYAANRLPWWAGQIARRIRPNRTILNDRGSGLKPWQVQREFWDRFPDRWWKPAGPVDSKGLVGILYRDLTSTNLPKLLRYEDRNSMAFSLEARLPYLDFRLVEMVFSLPLDYRIHNGWSKWILRQSLKNVIPPEICWRRSKLGYPTPEANWMLDGKSMVRQLLQIDPGDPVSAYFPPETLKQISQLPDSELVATPGLWRIINLILWFDIFFKRNPKDTVAKLSQNFNRGSY